MPTQLVRGLLYRLYEQRLLRQIRQRPLPRHLGLILDGHRRFARSAGVSSAEGYLLGAVKTEEVLGWCAMLGIPAVTLWSLSTENLARDPEELSAILDVIEERIAGWVRGGLAERLEIHIRAIGKLELLPASALRMLSHANEMTRHHRRMLLNIAIGYGGRQEIIDAVHSYLRESWTRTGSMDEILEALTPETVGKHLYAYDCPDPDLIIRTSGELRLSGFMLWQSVYSEFYFCDAYWPSFRKIDFLRALRSYQQRQRRFGK